jgi:hypothetical protein
MLLNKEKLHNALLVSLPFIIFIVFNLLLSNTSYEKRCSAYKIVAYLIVLITIFVGIYKRQFTDYFIIWIGFSLYFSIWEIFNGCYGAIGKFYTTILCPNGAAIGCINTADIIYTFDINIPFLLNIILFFILLYFFKINLKKIFLLVFVYYYLFSYYLTLVFVPFVFQTFKNNVIKYNMMVINQTTGIIVAFNAFLFMLFINIYLLLKKKYHVFILFLVYILIYFFFILLLITGIPIISYKTFMFFLYYLIFFILEAKIINYFVVLNIGEYIIRIKRRRL